MCALHCVLKHWAYSIEHFNEKDQIFNGCFVYNFANCKKDNVLYTIFIYILHSNVGKVIFFVMHCVRLFFCPFDILCCGRIKFIVFLISFLSFETKFFSWFTFKKQIYLKDLIVLHIELF